MRKKMIIYIKVKINKQNFNMYVKLSNTLFYINLSKEFFYFKIYA